MHVVLPTTKEAIHDLNSMTLLNFLSEHIDHFNPGKEIDKYKKMKWSSEPVILKNQINSIRKESTNGKSISYEDLINIDLPGSYFNGSKTDRNELKRISNGISKDEMFTTKYGGEKFDNLKGITATDAVRCYRVIKTLTPQSGAISNALMVITISKLNTMDISKEEKQMILKKVAYTKHILCQDAVSAKHGISQVTAAERIYSMFYRLNSNSLEDKDDYIKALIEFGVPKECADITIDMYWEEPPRSITEILRDLAPHYLLTRRSAGPGSFEHCINCKDEKSMHFKFLTRLFKKL